MILTHKNYKQEKKFSQKTFYYISKNNIHHGNTEKIKEKFDADQRR